MKKSSGQESNQLAIFQHVLESNMDLPKASVVSAPRGIWDLLLTDADHKSSLKSAAIFIILWNRTFKRQRSNCISTFHQSALLGQDGFRKLDW